MEENKKKVVENDINIEKQENPINTENTDKNRLPKIKFKGFLIFLGIICILLIGVKIVIWYTPKEIPSILENMRWIEYKGERHYIITGDYTREHQIATYRIDVADTNKPADVQAILTYEEYVDFCIERNIDVIYTDSNSKYAVFSYSEQNMSMPRLATTNLLGKRLDFYVWDKTARHQPVIGLSTGYAIIVPTYRSTLSLNVIPMYTEEEFEEITKLIEFPNILNQGDMMVKKPVIYLYPTKDTKVDVKLVNNNLLTCTYPKYEDKWSVLAKPNGDLTYIETGRSLYSLYYEADSLIDFTVTDEGFVIKGEDSAKFLEEKLEILGLNEHEAEEFIIYWLPILEANKYNYIRFATKGEIDSNMPLEVNPNPDSIIRVLMTYKGLKSPINVKEQVLETPNRDGFVLVEWGGTEI